MLDKFKKNLQPVYNIHEKPKILVAVSGGIDSMVMLDLFLKTNLEIGIAHCNFNLRGQESSDDAIFVEQKANEKNVDFFLNSFDTKEYADKNKISIQMAARNLRYEWFYQLQIKKGYDQVAVAHNLDDNIETFFINLLRGTGIKGITGMKMYNENILRPLLNVSRNDISEYAAQNNIQYREDSSNSSTHYIRNRIRHNIIPEFKECEPEFLNIMSKNMYHFSEAWTVFHKWVKQIEDKIVEKEDEIYKVNIDKLREFEDIHIIAYEILAPFHFSQTVISNIISCIDHQPGKQFYSLTHRCIKDRKYLLIGKISHQVDKKFYIDSTDEKIFFPLHLSFRITQNNPEFTIKKSSEIAQLDYDLLNFPLIIRRWNKGDYFQPLGMNGLKKVSDFFTDLKFSLFDKENTWILTSGEKIVWIIGHRIDDRFKINAHTKNILIISK